MNQDRLMQSIRKNLAAVAASQRQSEARGESIDRRMKKISVELKRIAQGFERAPDRSRGPKKR